MSNQDTKYKFAFALKGLMNTHSLEKITVNQIATQCNLTRQTFYRNFEDKYALVNWYFEKLVQDSFSKMNNEKTLLSALLNKFTFIQQELSFFDGAFKTQSYNSLVEYDYRYILSFYQQIIEKKLGVLPPDIAFSLELYCRGSISKTVEWVHDIHRCSPSQMANQLTQALPTNLKELLINFQ